MKRNNILIGSIVINVALVATACFMFYQLEQSKKSLQETELEARYEELVRELFVPAEALYLSPRAHNEYFINICELRKGYFPREFLPYTAIVRPGHATIHPSDELSHIANGSFETFWINEANGGLAKLASNIENGTELGAYIQAQAQNESAHMISLVERLLVSPTSHHRIRAARLLLALGYRDAKLLSVVQSFADEEMTPAISDGGTKMIYSWERNTAVELDKKYDLGIRDQRGSQSEVATP